MSLVSSVSHCFPLGDKSEVLDTDAPDLKRFPKFVRAKRYECVLEPGDLLFIPGRWSASFLLQPNMKHDWTQRLCFPQLCGFTTRSLCSLEWALISSGAIYLQTATTRRIRTVTKTPWLQRERFRPWRGHFTLWMNCQQSIGTSTGGAWFSAFRRGRTATGK